MIDEVEIFPRYGLLKGLFFQLGKLRKHSLIIIMVSRPTASSRKCVA